MWGSMHSDFRGAAKKLERENKERSQRAKLKSSKDQAEKERVKQRLAAHEDDQRQRRLAELYAQEQERMRHEEAVEHNNGIWWSTLLRAAPITSELAKRIKRSADKVSLPASAENDLTRQEASKNGAMLFEISARGKRTHAGVLDFTAVEGTVGLPTAMAQSLWGSAATPSGQDVTVTYRKLDRGTFVRFQPQSADFQKEVGADVETVLEQTLLTRSTLTEGDWVAVSHAERQWDLRVQQLQPAAQVSVIDTDMEADVEASLETEARVAAELEAAREHEAQLAAMAAAAKMQAFEQEQAERLEAERIQALRKAAAAALSPEPDASASEPVTTCLVRLPNGSRLTRKFYTSAPLQTLLNFIDAHDAAQFAPDSYQLVSSYPRKAVTGRLDGSLGEAGLSAGQHVLMLEGRKSDAA